MYLHVRVHNTITVQGSTVEHKCGYMYNSLAYLKDYTVAKQG